MGDTRESTSTANKLIAIIAVFLTIVTMPPNVFSDGNLVLQ